MERKNYCFNKSFISFLFLIRLSIVNMPLLKLNKYQTSISSPLLYSSSSTLCFSILSHLFPYHFTQNSHKRNSSKGFYKTNASSLNLSPKFSSFLFSPSSTSTFATSAVFPLSNVSINSSQQSNQYSDLPSKHQDQTDKKKHQEYNNQQQRHSQQQSSSEHEGKERYNPHQHSRFIAFFRYLFALYCQQLQRRPFTVQMATSGFLFAIGDISAQFYEMKLEKDQILDHIIKNINILLFKLLYLPILPNLISVHPCLVYFIPAFHVNVFLLLVYLVSL